MVDATRALLDELMGKERNVPLMERSNRELTFSSPEVCKYAIAGLCPYGLFRNTKSDLGAPLARDERACLASSAQAICASSPHQTRCGGAPETLCLP